MDFGLSEDNGVVDVEGVEVLTSAIEVLPWFVEVKEELLLVEVLLLLLETVVKEPLLLVRLLDEFCGELGLVDKKEVELVVLLLLDVNLKYYINGWIMYENFLDGGLG